MNRQQNVGSTRRALWDPTKAENMRWSTCQRSFDYACSTRPAAGFSLKVSSALACFAPESRGGQAARAAQLLAVPRGNKETWTRRGAAGIPGTALPADVPSRTHAVAARLVFVNLELQHYCKYTAGATAGTAVVRYCVAPLTKFHRKDQPTETCTTPTTCSSRNSHTRINTCTHVHRRNHPKTARARKPTTQKQKQNREKKTTHTNAYNKKATNNKTTKTDQANTYKE